MIQIFLAEDGFPKLNTVVIVVKMVVLLLQTTFIHCCASNVRLVLVSDAVCFFMYRT